MMKRTKMICTIGPASNNKTTLIKMIKEGMSCARINFSHGTHDSLKEMIDNCKAASKEAGVLLPLLLDTKGPEIRVLDFKDGSIILKKNQLFIFDDKEDLGDENRVGLSFKELAKSVKPGTTIMGDDGRLQFKVIKIEGLKITTKVIAGGKISNHKSLNVPNVSIDMPFMSEKDKSDLLFGIEQDMDFVAASFTRTYEDMKEMRDFLDANGGEKMLIIAKIENMQGIRNFNKILEIADGIMVARGDLGVEIPFAQIPGYQKYMIDTCNQKGKIAVVATQMLESMTDNPRPTRAEVSDVANAVYDGATAIMLSGESASGKYPVQAVKTMADIAITSERSESYKEDLGRKVTFQFDHSVTQTVCMAAVNAAEYIKAKAILAITCTGYTAKAISIYRPNVPIVALIRDVKAARQLSLRYNVFPILQGKNSTLAQTVINKRNEIISLTKGKTGDKYILIAGTSFTEGHTDTLNIYTL